MSIVISILAATGATTLVAAALGGIAGRYTRRPRRRYY